MKTGTNIGHMLESGGSKVAVQLIDIRNTGGGEF